MSWIGAAARAQRRSDRQDKRAFQSFAFSRWRVSCATCSDWMVNQAKVAVVVRGGQIDQETEKATGNIPTEYKLLYDSVRYNAKKSIQAAQTKGLELWRYPGYADMAISRMQAADAALTGLLPDVMFAGEIPRIRDTVQHYLPADDPRRQYLMNPLQYAEKYPDPAEIIPAGAAAGPGPAKSVGRYRIEGALRGAYVANGFTRGRLRQFNKILLVAAFILMGLTLLLGFLDASWPSSLTCTSALRGNGKICPLGNSGNPSDVFIVELIGAAGAAMSAIVSLSRSRSVEDPYMVHVAQAVLKVSLGGITAVLGLLLLFAAPGVHLESTWQILAYAVVFGYSRQLFTRLVDSKGEELQKAASPTTRQSPPPDG